MVHYTWKFPNRPADPSRRNPRAVPQLQWGTVVDDPPEPVEAAGEAIEQPEPDPHQNFCKYCGTGPLGCHPNRTRPRKFCNQRCMGLWAAMRLTPEERIERARHMRACQTSHKPASTGKGDAARERFNARFRQGDSYEPAACME